MKIPLCSCGGTYVKTAQTPIQIRNLFGFDGGVESHRWRVFICNECGHVAIYRAGHDEPEA